METLSNINLVLSVIIQSLLLFFLIFFFFMTLAIYFSVRRFTKKTTESIENLKAKLNEAKDFKFMENNLIENLNFDGVGKKVLVGAKIITLKAALKFLKSIFK